MRPILKRLILRNGHKPVCVTRTKRQPLANLAPLDDLKHASNLPEKFDTCVESGNLAKNRPPQIVAAGVLGVG